jgi:hypothetical protein
MVKPYASYLGLHFLIAEEYKRDTLPWCVNWPYFFKSEVNKIVNSIVVEVWQCLWPSVCCCCFHDIGFKCNILLVPLFPSVRIRNVYRSNTDHKDQPFLSLAARLHHSQTGY